MSTGSAPDASEALLVVVCQDALREVPCFECLKGWISVRRQKWCVDQLNPPPFTHGLVCLAAGRLLQRSEHTRDDETVPALSGNGLKSSRINAGFV